ncbi:hypothetical protein [Streptomyces sp. NPDC017991]|uniref:hypothetical protein n=1 Tax=Streptomyces sp. NPDC017991 TaxID=3365026 RepID=UPI0037AE1130
MSGATEHVRRGCGEGDIDAADADMNAEPGNRSYAVESGELISGGAAVETALAAQGVDLGVVFLAQLRIQRDTDNAPGTGRSPGDIPVVDELADGAFVGTSGCLSGSEPVEGDHELVQVLQDCDDLVEGHADLLGDMFIG